MKEKQNICGISGIYLKATNCPTESLTQISHVSGAGIE